MANARQIIDNALALLGATSQGISPNDIQYSEAFKFLKSMVNTYEARGYNIASKIKDTLALVGGQATYTIGTQKAVSKTDMFLKRKSNDYTFPFVKGITGTLTATDSAGNRYYSSNASAFSYDSTTGICTLYNPQTTTFATNGTDIIVITPTNNLDGWGNWTLINGEYYLTVQVSTTGTLPTPLVASTDYLLKGTGDLNIAPFYLYDATTYALIDMQDGGTGTHTMANGLTAAVLSANTSYTIQAELPAPDFDIGRPAPEKILSAYTNLGGSDYPVEVLSNAADYDIISNKSTSSSALQRIYYEFNPSDFEYSTITFYPVPSGGANVYIRYLDINESLVGTNLYDWAFPDDTEEFLSANLAIRLAPTYDKEPTQMVIAIADVATKAMVTKKKEFPKFRFDDALLHSRAPRVF